MEDGVSSRSTRTGSETVLFVAAPNAFAGNFTVHSATQFFGADGNVLFSTGPNGELGGPNDTLCHVDVPMRIGVR